MAKFKLVTSAKHKFGNANQVPYAGRIVFDAQGYTTVEVRDEADLNALLKAVPDLSLVVEKSNPIADPLKVEDPLKVAPSEVKKEEIKSQVEANTIGKSAEVKNDLAPKTEKSEPIKAEVKKEEPKAEEVVEDFATSLNKLTIVELDELAKDFPESEWKGLKEDELRTYLAAKLK